jgi:hypothetical protein
VALHIHVVWEGPLNLKGAYELKDAVADYGVYQIYGRHPVAGVTSLLYIGKADKQTFGVRLKQERWELWEEGEGPVEIRVGRLFGTETPTDDEWTRQIHLTESLLLAANKPPRNQHGVAWLSTDADASARDLHVLNWGAYGAILPEVSGARWSSKFDKIEGFGRYEWKKAPV